MEKPEFDGRTPPAIAAAYDRFYPQIISDLMHEVVRAEKMHGPLPTDYCRAQTIACEEMGEVAEATLEMGRHSIHTMRDRWIHLREEWIQLAAVCIRAVENLDKEDT